MISLIGQSLGRYHILEQLGEGGMATVFKAYDTGLDRHVAIKVIRQTTFSTAGMEKARRRFNREAKVLASFDHENIVGVLDFGEQSGLQYIVMKYIPGGTLKDLLKKSGPMKWREVAQLLLPIARALKYAHQHDIIHRDIKPANILITESGKPMLSDFGIAKILESDSPSERAGLGTGTEEAITSLEDQEATRDAGSGIFETASLTGSRVGIGTPSYMSPEQGMGYKLDGRTDIYSLGIVFYEMLTGRTPFRADTPEATVKKHIFEPLPGPKKFVASIPDQIEYVLIKALEKDPANRYQDAGQFADTLERLLADQISRPLPWKFIIPALGVILMFGAILFVSGFNRLYSSTEPTSQPLPTGINVQSTSTMLQPYTPTPSPSETFTLAAQAPFFWIKDGMEMIRIPEGEFIRGMSLENKQALLSICPSCPVADEMKDAMPQAVIYLDAFWIDRTEITNAQFEKFVSETGYQTTAETTDDYSFIQDLGLRDFVYDGKADWRHPHGRNSNILGRETHPVTQVSWGDASAYCSWAGKRLPTEAEWEKAARGTDGRLFPWGNEGPRSDLLNYNYNLPDTAAVGSFPTGQNSYGLLDMAGNVWEFVSDAYSEDYYSKAPDSNPANPKNGEGHVFRGGSWASEHAINTHYVTTMYRMWNVETISSDVLGFRCVVDQVE